MLFRSSRLNARVVYPTRKEERACPIYPSGPNQLAAQRLNRECSLATPLRLPRQPSCGGCPGPRGKPPDGEPYPTNGGGCAVHDRCRIPRAFWAGARACLGETAVCGRGSRAVPTSERPAWVQAKYLQCGLCSL